MDSLQLKCIKGKELEAYIADLAALRIQIFRDYPYLYAGDVEYEKKYLSTYANCPNSFLVLILDQNQVIGASTAIPLKDETDAVQAPFLQQGINIQSVFYLGESVLLPAYRGQKIGERFFAERENEARKQACTITSFCAVERLQNDPRRPVSWHPLDKFWQRLGYHKRPELTTTFSWKEIGEQQETPKPMTFWMKQL